MQDAYEQIESRQNSRFRHWLAIAGQNRGKKTGQVLLEGLRLCRDAVASGVAVDTAIVAAGAAPAILRFVASLPPDVPRVRLNDQLFALLSDTETPQGLALVCRSPVLVAPPGAACPDRLYLVADGIADPGNLGTMIRTADAFAFAAVLFTDGTVWPMNPKVVRAAMGACFHLPLIRFVSIQTAAAWLSASGVPLIAADPHAGEPLSSLQPGGAALLVGNEAHGISHEAHSAADRFVRIPMPGRAESLNAAAATAICAYALMQANAAAGFVRPEIDMEPDGNCSVKRS